MVRRLITQDLCDGCLFLQLPPAEAVTEHIAVIDGGPLRRVMFCAHCAKAPLPFITIYTEYGQDVEISPSPPQRAGRSTKKSKAVKASKPKELENTHSTDSEPTAKKQIVCPLPHASAQGGPLRVTYAGRVTHAGTHDGAKVWDIAWQDPDGILTAFCTEHEMCVKNNVGFTSQRGVNQHIVAERDKLPARAHSEEDGDGQFAIP